MNPSPGANTKGFGGSARSGQTGLTGATGGVTSLGQLTQLVRANFTPASKSTPPQGGVKTSGRQATRPSQATSQPLVAGATTWAFPTAFNAKPTVNVTMEGAPASGTPAIYITLIKNATGGFSGVSVTSTLSTDVRIAHITATGNPN